MLLINVYFPTSSRTDYKDVSLDILSGIVSIINTCDHKSILLGGDFNCDLESVNWSSKIVREFMDDND